MTTMNISVPDEMKAFVEAQMVQEGYTSASEYLRARRPYDPRGLGRLAGRGD
jgi:Arc/MetJ-type ribon-helix-helix transcriptional regulator